MFPLIPFLKSFFKLSVLINESKVGNLKLLYMLNRFLLLMLTAFQPHVQIVNLVMKKLEGISTATLWADMGRKISTALIPDKPLLLGRTGFSYYHISSKRREHPTIAICPSIMVLILSMMLSHFKFEWIILLCDKCRHSPLVMSLPCWLGITSDITSLHILYKLIYCMMLQREFKIHPFILRPPSQ